MEFPVEKFLNGALSLSPRSAPPHHLDPLNPDP
jgi:hypothetical protein